ncbi:hypothetical protein D3C71_1891740 [compost metagenome]
MHRAGQLAGVGVQQQLVRIEAVPVLRVVRAMGAVAIDQPGLSVRQIAVPDLIGAFRQIEAAQFLAAFRVEQAQFHAGGVGGEDREVHAQPIAGCA